MIFSGNKNEVENLPGFDVQQPEVWGHLQSCLAKVGG